MRERYCGQRPEVDVKEFYRFIRSASEMAYRFTSEELKIENIGPDSNYCFKIAWELKRIMNLRYENVKMVCSEIKVNGSEVIDHGFLKVNFDSCCFGVDPSYRQFIPEEKKPFSPRVLIFPAFDEEFIKEVLRRCNIPEEYHTSWTKIFFE